MWKAVFATILATLLVTALDLSANVQLVRAFGTIHIGPDGVIDPLTTHIVTADNVTYTFTDNVYGSIVIQRSHIIVDGSGYIVHGDGTERPDAWGFRIGISLLGVENVTIKNTNIKGFHIGVGLEDASICTVSGSTIAANNPIGIAVTDSSNCSILGNNIGNNQVGIYLGVPRQSNLVHPSNFNVVSDNIIKDNYEGIYLSPCSNFNRIFGNSVENNYWGIEFFDSFANSILENNITHSHRGVDFRYSFRNTVSGNDITANIQYAILFREGSAFNNVSGNTIANSSYGVCLDDSHYNFIFENNLEHDECELRLLTSSKNSFYHNNFMTDQTDILDSVNVWDNGYPLGGNYWGSHSIPDNDMDRIGDRPCVIDTNNADRYPLTYPYGFVPKPDVDGDGVVDNDDLSIVAMAFGSKPGDSVWTPFADADTNEVINMIDVAKTARQYDHPIH